MKTLVKGIFAIVVIIVLAILAVVIVRGLHTPNNEVIVASNEAAISEEIARQMAMIQPTAVCPQCNCNCPACPEVAVESVATAVVKTAEAVEAEAVVDAPAFVPEKKTDQVLMPKYSDFDGTLYVYYYNWNMGKTVVASGFAALPQYQSANGFLVGRQARQWLYRSIDDRYLLMSITYVTYEEGLSLVDIIDGITVEGPNDSFALAVEDVTRQGNVLVAQMWFSETESHWDIIRRAEGELVVAVPHYKGISRPAPVRRNTTVVVNNNNGGNDGHGGEQPQLDPTPVWEDPEVPTPEPTQQPITDWDPSFNWPTEEPQPQPTPEQQDWDPSFNWEEESHDVDPQPVWEETSEPVSEPVAAEDWSGDFNFESSSDTDPAPVWEGASEPVSEPVAAEDWSDDFNFGSNTDPAALWD